MPLQCTEVEFYDEWEMCWRDEHRDTTKIYQMIKPFIQRWATHLRHPEGALEVNFVSLMGLIQSNGDPFALIKNWVEVSDLKSSVEEELTLLFFERLRNYRFIPKLKEKRHKGEFLVARDYKLFLRNRIRDCWTATHSRKPIRFEEAYEPEYPDWFIVASLEADPWKCWVVDHVLGDQREQLLATMNWSNKQFTTEVEKICQPLKKRLQSK